MGFCTHLCLRWAVLSSFLVAAIGFAGPTPEGINPGEVITHIAPEVRKDLSPQEEERLRTEIARLAKEAFTYSTDSLTSPAAARVGEVAKDTAVFFSHSIRPESEIEDSRFEYAEDNARPRGSIWSMLFGSGAAEPSERWGAEQWAEFKAHGTVSYASANFPTLRHVFKVTTIFGRHILYKGLNNILVDVKKNFQTGIHELVVVIPESLWPKDYSQTSKNSVKKSFSSFVQSMRAVLSQVYGLEESVPRYSESEVEVLVDQIARHAIVTSRLEAAAQGALLGQTHKPNVYLSALNLAAEAWNKDGEQAAEKEVSAKLDVIRKERGLAPATEATLRKNEMQIAEREFTTRFLLQDEALQNIAIHQGADLRLMDEELMAVVEKRVAELEKAHEQRWEKISATVSSQIYSSLYSRFQSDPDRLVQETVDQLQRQKQENFFEVLLQDRKLDTCHPRARGIAKLLVEKGKAREFVAEREHQFASELWNQRAAVEEEVNATYPIRSFSEQFRNEKVAALLTERYQRDRNTRYRRIVAELRAEGMPNSATLLDATLDELETVSDLRKVVRDQKIPARAFVWTMPALQHDEWSVITEDGKSEVRPVFQNWVTTQDQSWRWAAFANTTEHAYRAAIKNLYHDQFLNGPVGLKAWTHLEPFHYLEMFNAETGQVEFDETKKRDTWFSNMQSIATMGSQIWNAKAPGIVPKIIWRPSCWAVATAATPTLMLLSTSARLAGSAAVLPTTAIAAASAKIWSPLYGLMSMGSDHLAYDLHAPIPEEGKLAFKEDPDARASYLSTLKWLALGGTGLGAAFGGYTDWVNFATSSWIDLGQNLGFFTGTGLAAGLGLSSLAALEKRNVARLPSQIFSGVTASFAKLTAAIAKIPALAMKTIGYNWGTQIVVKGGSEWARDFAVREIFLKTVLDKFFVWFGSEGVTIPVSNWFFAHQHKGPGTASQNFLGMQPDLALACLFARFEKIDLDNWVARQTEESAGPRQSYLETVGMTQIAATGTRSFTGPIAAEIEEFEKKAEKYRKQVVADRQKMVAPLTTLATAVKGKLRFFEKDLQAIRIQAAEMAKMFFTELADPQTTEVQKTALWSNVGVATGDWQALGDKLLEEIFGVGVLQSMEGADQSAYSTYEGPKIRDILMQVAKGQNVELRSTVTVHTVPEAVTKATSALPFHGTGELCSRYILAQAKLPWANAGPVAAATK